MSSEVSSAIGLRACYAMSGTDLEMLLSTLRSPYRASLWYCSYSLLLRALRKRYWHGLCRYAVNGTDIGYGATQAAKQASADVAGKVTCPLSTVMLRICYGKPGTEVGYGGTEIGYGGTEIGYGGTEVGYGGTEQVVERWVTATHVALWLE
eukprot:2784694-Rhodomonas_salina.1